MDRVIVTDAAIPQATDLLNTNKFAMVGHAFLARAILGSATAVHGLACAPTTPASLQVTVGAGSIYSLDAVDATAYSDLGVDINNILKQGILYSPVTLTITPPSTPGYSQVFLIEAILEDVDGGSMVVPFYNPAILTNPTAMPYAGPNNSGTSQNTTRTVVCNISLKAGAAAPTGTQTTPAPDAGYTGLYSITVANGQTTVTAANIVQLASAPFFPTLPSVPADVQAGIWEFAQDTGVASAAVVTLTPAPTSYTAGMSIRVKMAAAPNGASVISCNGLGNKSIVTSGAAPTVSNSWLAGDIVTLTYDGTNFQAQRPIASLSFLGAPKTIYVNGGTGSDTLYDGTSATISGTQGPFATIQHAISVMQTYNLNGFNVTISVANGTYTGPVICSTINGSGTVTIVGNTTTPQSVTVTQTQGSAFIVTNSGWIIKGFGLNSFAAQGADPGNGVWCTGAGASCQLSNLFLGLCYSAHLEASNGGSISLTGPITVGGNAVYCLEATVSGNITINPVFTPTLTIANNVTISHAFATAYDGGTIWGRFTSISGPGAVTGGKYDSENNGIIDTLGSGASYYPGTTAGATATGGLYS